MHSFFNSIQKPANQQKAEWLKLSGNLCITLAIEIDSESFVEKGIQKFTEAENLLDPMETQAGLLFWDLAKAWSLLYNYSGDLSDLQKGLSYFQKARSILKDLPELCSEYADNLIVCAELSGNPAPLEDALSLLSGVVSLSVSNEKESPSSLSKVWISYAHAAKLRFELTHKGIDLEAANKILQESALNNPDSADIWLAWGELFLHSGLVSHHIGDIEKALEKLTSSKVKECNPLKVSGLLSQGLIMLGYLLDDVKLIREGKERSSNALNLAPNLPILSFTSALSDLYLGLYFSEAKLLIRAIKAFENNLKKDSKRYENLFGLFQACMGLGLLREDFNLLKKGLGSILKLCEVRPFSPAYLNEKGIALLKISELEPNLDFHQEIIEEATSAFNGAWNLAQNDEIFFNLGCAMHLLAECTANEEDYLKAINILSEVHDKRGAAFSVRYRLALALAHYGELAQDEESLWQAHDLFSSLEERDSEQDNVYCDHGYALLNLAEFKSDVHSCEQAEWLRREAEKQLIRSVELGNVRGLYHLACLYSLCGLFERSLIYLRKASEHMAMPSLEDLEEDIWLNGVRNTDAFQEFITTHKRSM